MSYTIGALRVGTQGVVGQGACRRRKGIYILRELDVVGYLVFYTIQETYRCTLISMFDRILRQLPSLLHIHLSVLFRISTSCEHTCIFR